MLKTSSKTLKYKLLKAPKGLEMYLYSWPFKYRHIHARTHTHTHTISEVNFFSIATAVRPYWPKSEILKSMQIFQNLRGKKIWESVLVPKSSDRVTQLVEKRIQRQIFSLWQEMKIMSQRALAPSTEGAETLHLFEHFPWGS